MPDRGFLIFWIFLLLFSEFSCPGRVWTEFGTKISFCLSRPISSCFGYKKYRKGVFWFFDFFFYFFRNFLTRVEYERNSGLNFFSLFLGLYHPPFWLKGMPERGFSIFWIFLPFFFRNFHARVEYERNSWLRFLFVFLGLSHPVLAIKNTGKGFFGFLIFFSIFFAIFLPWSSMNGIRD